MLLAIVALGGCGGPIESDVALITGQTTPTSAVRTPTTVATGIVPPVVVEPTQGTLFAGFGTLPNRCNGGSQTFTVRGSATPFVVTATGGCLSSDHVSASGGTFVFTAGDLPGEYEVTIADDLGRTVVVVVDVVGAPVAFLELDGAPEQRSDNGDGTFTSVFGAVVTDMNGVAVPDGVPVEFTLVNPVAGVSVTSPGFTNEAAPCTPGGTVQEQPGDALSCIKYAQSLQGSTVVVRARVRAASGEILADEASLVLPDDRPFHTATSTRVPTSTPTSPPTLTATPTPQPAQIQIALFVDQASDNGDGTLSSVVSALVTDVTGAVAGNGIAVRFALEPPVPAGVSVTSPGLIGGSAPCTLGFAVVPQPGDALSCVKYDRARQGETVTVRATVDTSSGSLTTTQVIVLPDLRPTPTQTFTFSPSPTSTSTPTPAAAHIQLALFVDRASDNGDGTLSSVISALVTDATGAVAGNGIAVQFALEPPVPAGVSVTSPGLIGAGAPCTLGFAVVPQPGDALSCVKYDRARQGETVTVRATVDTPSGSLTTTQVIVLPDLRPTPTHTSTSTPTATVTLTPTPAGVFIQLALFESRASDNGDGTLSAVVSALVTDGAGAAIGNGVLVQFALASPVAGISVTSPGFTGQSPPCTLGFPVIPQPGDALACIKYDKALQGATTTIVATVQGAGGPLTAEQAITLPDVRTPTPSQTSTATQTPTRTPTSTATVTSTPTPAAAHIQLALFVDQASDNGDGTLSSVISALVTDATGATIGNDVPVQFRLVSPIPGVSVTSPGLTGRAVPCTLGFTVVSQPGDALSCIKYDRALQGQPVTIEASVQTPGGPITSSQSITLPDLRPTATATATATASPTPTQLAAAIQFLGAVPPNIGVRASGLPEQSVLSFRITSATGNPVAGLTVHFQLIGLDDETIEPLEAVTDDEGVASTTLTTGTRAATIRVIASADRDGDGVIDVVAQSTAVTITGAPATLGRFSVAARRLNVAGRRFFGLRDDISAFVNDRFGNAVPPGTAVTFVSNGASVVGTGLTDADGVATTTLITEASIPPSGIVTVLAFTRGEEDFIDNNGNGVFDAGIDTIIDENVPEPFIDFRPPPPLDASCPILPPSPSCNGQYDVGQQFELFVDANHNGIWDTQGISGQWDTDILVFDVVPVTFSGTLVTPVASPQVFAIADGEAQGFTLDVHDDLLNPLVGGSTITVTVTGGTVFGGSITVPDGESFNQIVPGLTRFSFVVGDTTPGEDPPKPPVPTSVVVTITSDNGNGTFIVATGTID